MQICIEQASQYYQVNLVLTWGLVSEKLSLVNISNWTPREDLIFRQGSENSRYLSMLLYFTMTSNFFGNFEMRKYHYYRLCYLFIMLFLVGQRVQWLTPCEHNNQDEHVGVNRKVRIKTDNWSNPNLLKYKEYSPWHFCFLSFSLFFWLCLSLLLSHPCQPYQELECNMGWSLDSQWKAWGGCSVVWLHMCIVCQETC